MNKFKTAIVLLVLLINPIVALAQGSIKMGRVEVHPGLSFGAEYDDNVFHEANKTFASGGSEGKSDDFIFITSPSIKFLLDRKPGEFFGFDLNYVGTDEHFVDLTDENTFKHDLFGFFNFGGPGGRSDLKIGGRFYDSRDPSSSEFASNNNPRAGRNLYRGYAEGKWTVSRLFYTDFHASVDRNEYDQLSLRDEDTDAWRFGASLFWQYTKLTSFGIKYDLRVTDFHEISASNFDSHDNTFLFSLAWAPKAIISGNIDVGIVDRGVQGIVGQNRTEFVAQLDLLYAPTRRTSLSLTGKRSVEDSSFGTIQSTLIHRMEMIYQQHIWKKLKGEVRFWYENVDYGISAVDTALPGGSPAHVRIDDKVFASYNLIYDIQDWLSAKFGFSYKENFSNFDAKDYINKVGSITLSAKF